MLEYLISLWLRLRALVLRRRLERHLDDELLFHLEMRQEKLEMAGLSSARAFSAARQRLGSLALVRERSRSVWTFATLEEAGRDLRYACRTLVRAPVFATVAIATLAFGIGTNTAVFSVVSGILLREMPYRNPADLYCIREAVEAGNQHRTMTGVNGGNVLEWIREARSFEAIAAMMPSNDTLIRGTETTNIHGLRASASLATVLGLQPRIGRWFVAEEDLMGKGLRVVLTDELWRAKFDADPAIVGKNVSLNGYDAAVIGVLASGFYFPKQNQVYGEQAAKRDFRIEYFLNLNLGSWDRKPGVGNFNYAAIGRVRGGVRMAGALVELEAIEKGISRQSSSGAILHAELVPFRAGVVGAAAERIWMLMAGAALVMVIVCVNLAGLILGRNAARMQEVAIRLAIGAGRWTILRQMATEGLCLAIAGGALGVAAAFVGVRLLVRHAPITLPRLETVTIDAQVLLFSTAVALGAGLLFSLVPAIRLHERCLEGALRASTPGLSSSRLSARMHGALAGVEITLCTTLLICALLLSQSLSRVLEDNVLLNQERVITIEIAPSPKQYQNAAARVGLYRDLLEGTRQLPGVTHAGLISALPLHGEVWDASVDLVEVPRREIQQPTANMRFMSPGYDDGIGLALVSGRRLQEFDFGRPLAWISESLAREFPGRSPVGMHMRWHQPGTGKELSLEVAGIVRDVRAEAEKKAPSTVYMPYWIWPTWNPAIVVRAAADPAGVAAGVQRLIRRAHGEVAVTRVEALRDTLQQAVASRRFLTGLGVVFAASAVFLATLGIYGVVALATARRRREIAIRLAMGASHSKIMRMVLGKAVRLSAISAAAGVAGGFGLASATVSLLYEVRPVDPVVYAMACVIVVAIALAASLVPAIRAARVDPITTLKYE
jgi:putative ABC transport system permease protein